MKRILLIDHPQFTSATYYLWQGLKELEALYPDQLSISCYPYIPTNYDEDTFDLKTLPWFLWLDSLVGEWKKGSANPPHGIPPLQGGERLTSGNETSAMRGSCWRKFKKENLIEDEATAISSILDRKFDLVILGNSHRVPTILLARLKEQISNFPPVIYFDAGERDELNEHWVHVFRPDLTFKQILTPEVRERGLSVKIPNYNFKIYPLPLSSPIVGCPDASLDGLSIRWLREQSRRSSKMIQVFYALGNTWPKREALTRALDDLVIRKDISRVKNCTYLNYHIVMAESRMAVTMRGSGRDTNHYWDIPLYKTAMISDGTMGCIHPYPFEDQKTAIFYRSIQELVETVERYLPESGYHSMELNRIAIAGQEHLERYHSTTARAVFFLDILDQEMNFMDVGLRAAVAGWKSDKHWRGGPWEGPVV